MNVSIIIPAHNASTMLNVPIESLLGQTYPHWEAIIVDDGSTDATTTVATQYAQQEPRIRTISQVQQGVSAARNAGVQLAQYDWLLFLDADDWIAPEYLERMTAIVAANETVDVACCGWVRVAPDGSLLEAKFPPTSSDLFPILTQYCPFAMHACLVKHAAFKAAGGFDAQLATCEDWDLWQRIARQGKHFVGIPEVLAFYQMRLGSLSRNASQFLSDGLSVLKQGGTSDARVHQPCSKYANGLPSKTFNNHAFYFTSWTAGLLIGVGKDARNLLQHLDGTAPGLMPQQVAEAFLESVLLPTCCPVGQWWQLWPQVQTSLQQFLSALERSSQTSDLAKRVLVIMERFILEHPQTPLPLQIGGTYGLSIDVFEPFDDLIFPVVAEQLTIERLHGKVVADHQYFGMVTLPVYNNCVSQVVLKDQIAAQFWWEILGCCFTATTYQSNDDHSDIGWLTLLRDIWNRPNAPNARFYQPSLPDRFARTIRAENDTVTVEVSESLPNVIVDGLVLRVVLTVGELRLVNWPLQ
ncbi:MAG: glycosyltransferase family 2 protein [Phormidesmis sp. RL_2_1]|nr:glycosyltransferase family 2 protein [Phormidesmis sp. RL_2_1]